MYRCDCSSRIRGGALLYIPDTLVVSNVKTFDDNTCESVICTIDSINLIVTSICSPLLLPSLVSPKSCHTCKTILTPQITTKNPFVTGDFNFPNMNWGKLSFRQTLGTNNNQACELLLNFMGKKLLNQVVDQKTRNKNTLDIVLANNVRDILDVSSDPTSLSNYNIVGIKLGYNALANQDKALPKTFSFQSLDIYQGDMVALNFSQAEIDWQALFDHCNTENDDLNENNEFAELLRLKVLQLCNIHCPKKAPIVAKTSTNRNISVLHRKRRKMKTRLHCLQNHQPHSSTIPYLQEQLSLLQLSIRDSITEELSKRE